MKLPEDRLCPNKWINCEDCKYVRECTPRNYHIETDLEVVIKAAEAAERSVNAEVKKVVRETWAQKYDRMTEDERWQDYYRYHVPDLMSREPLPLDGPSAPGGGGKCRVPKKPQKKMPEYLKTFGQ